MPLGVADERPGIDGVVNLLLVQRLARNVDGLEPLQLLRRLTLADIDGQRIIQYVLLDVLRLVVELLEIVEELVGHILANG